MHTVTILAANVPHVFTPVAMPTWMSQFFVSVIGVILFDMWADKIPGVARLSNRIPQVLTLITTATAVSTLQDTRLIGSFSMRLVDLSNRISTGLSGLWNITGTAITVVVAGLLGLRYMNSERLFWDGMFFGIAVLTLSILVPWVGKTLEFWRFSILTGVCNIFVIVVSWAVGLTIS